MPGVLVFGLLLAIFGCEFQSASSSQEPVQLENAPAHLSSDARFSVYDDNEPRAEITAAYMAHYDEEDSTYTVFQGDSSRAEGRVRAHVFDENGDSSAVITADRMIYYDEESRFEARGQVVVETTDGKHLESEHLTWHEDERKIRTPEFVRITTSTDRVQGYGLEADEDLASYKLANVTGETTVEDN